MRSLRTVAVAAAMLFAFIPPGQSQVNGEDAEEIRRALKVWIGQTLQPVSEELAVELDGQIEVLANNAGYRVTVPGGRAVAPDSGTLHFGETTIDLTPLDNGWYDASWQLPDNYRLESNGGSDRLITVGGQSGRGIFAPEFQTIMSMDAEFSAIEFAPIDDDGRLTIDQITIASRSTEVSPGVYDIQSTWRFGGLLFTENAGRNTFALSDMETVLSTEDGRLADFEDTPDSTKSLMAGFRMEIWHGAGSIQNGSDRFSTEMGTYTLTFDGLDRELWHIGLDLIAEGLVTNDPDLATLLPTGPRIRLAATNLPTEGLPHIALDMLVAEIAIVNPRSVLFNLIRAVLIASLIDSSPDSEIGPLPDAEEISIAILTLMALTGMLSDLQDSLVSAGSQLEVGPILLASDIGSIEFEGVATVPPSGSPPDHVYASADIVAIGLDALTAQIQRIRGYGEVIQFLTLLQSVGAQAPDANGRTVHFHTFEVEYGGRLLLNGSDIQPLMDTVP